MMKDEAVAIAMAPLLERGSSELKALLANVPIERRPIGLSVLVITEADFVAHARLVLMHVCLNAKNTHVLCDSGILCLRVERIGG